VAGNSFTAWELGYEANATIKANPKEFLGSTSYWSFATEWWRRIPIQPGLMTAGSESTFPLQ
jgi:hypothetical protein